MNLHEINEYKKISFEIEEKLSKCQLTIDDLFCQHLYYGKNFTDPMGIYIVFEKKKYTIYYLNIHGIENIETFNTMDDLVFQIIWDGLIAYSYRKSKQNSHEMALELLKKIDIDYYNKMIKY